MHKQQKTIFQIGVVAQQGGERTQRGYRCCLWENERHREGENICDEEVAFVHVGQQQGYGKGENKCCQQQGGVAQTLSQSEKQDEHYRAEAESAEYACFGIYFGIGHVIEHGEHGGGVVVKGTADR